METYDPKLLKENLYDFYDKKTVFYGFNVINDNNALIQAGSGYRTMAIVDSALTSGNSSELTAGSIIYREPNLMSFVIPQNYRSVFAIVKAVTESGVANKYMRLMIGYGENGNTEKEIGRSAQTNADARTEMTLLGSYAGLVADRDEYVHKIKVQTYGEMRYNSINILIGVTL